MPASRFTEFAGASLPALVRYAYALTGGPAAGDDLVQDTLVKVWGSWRRIRADGNPLAYARTVMFRTYVSRWRAVRRRPAVGARPLPAGAGEGQSAPTHDGHAPVLWVDGAGALAVGGANRRYWTTTDGGVTWRESPTPSVAGSIVTVGPGDTLTPLANHPPLPDPVPNPRTPLVPAADGSYWVECVEDRCALVTRDSGQTWQTVPIDTDARVQWLATVDGRTLYAGGGPTVVRSADGGTTWTALAGSGHLPEGGYVGLVLPGGDLLVGTYEGLYRLPAGAGTVERVPGTPTRINTLYRTGGWLVAAPVWDSAGEGSTASVSPDGGATWVRVPPDA